MAFAGLKKQINKANQYWADIKHKTKTRLARRRQDALGTGGGPSNQEDLSEIDKKVLAIIGKKAVYGDTEHRAPVFYVTEKMGGAEGTKLDLDFVEMERKTDVTCELVEELQTKTKEFLQPNPTARAKMAAVKGISKLSGQAKSNTYPQPEGVLGDCMLLYGKKLGEDTVFSNCLIEMGEALKQMADVKYSLDDNIKQNFLEPLHHLQTKDLKEVMHHRKKLQGRRLDFDCKRRRQAKGPGRASPYMSPSHNTPRQDDEIRQAEEKFAESLHLAQIGMFNLLDNDVEQVAQLTFFAEGLLEYHQQCTEILKGLVATLMERKEEAVNRPKMEFVPKTLADLHIEGIHDMNNGRRYGSTQSLSRPRQHIPPSSSVGDLSTTDPFKAWEAPTPPRAQVRPAPGFKPHPAPRNQFNGRDPWTAGSHAGTPEHKPPSNLELFPGSGNASRSTNASPLPSPVKSPARTPVVANKTPCCTALYDFEPENQGELGFKENDVITLINKVDDNWFEGSVNGKTGYFPISYVQVTVPLPNM